MKPTKAQTKEHIIIATIECIEQKGIQSVTVRDIAGKAGINIAAVNYYFGSKEDLLKEALTYSLYASLSQNYEEITEANHEPYSMIKAFFKEIFQGSLQWPNVTRSHIYGPIIDNNYQGVFVDWLNDIAGDLTAKVQTINTGKIDTETLKLTLVQMLSTLLLWSLMPDLFNRFLGYDFRDTRKQDLFIDLLLERYLAPVVTPREPA
jgi:TetR/AcrR family transcriptional regulator, regulator of cefoperazone and chloramphenicol sensitivity